MNRRGFLKAILAAGVAPYVVTKAGVLMPVKRIVTPAAEWVPVSRYAADQLTLADVPAVARQLSLLRVPGPKTVLLHPNMLGELARIGEDYELVTEFKA